MKRTLITTACILFLLNVNAQSISIATGIGTDANNSGNGLAFIPVEIAWSPFHDNPLSFIISYDFGLGTNRNADAFTLNPNLPEHTTIKEHASTHILTFGANLDVKLFHTSPENVMILSVMPAGFSFQKTKVSYRNFDNENYSILNQNVDQVSSGFVMAFGLRYRFNKNKFVSLGIQTPLIKTRSKYTSYKYAAPARLMVGYQFHYKKSK